MPDEGDFDFSNSLDARLEGLGLSNAAVSFARECLRLDPAQRPSAATLLQHDYFQSFTNQFESQIQQLKA